MAKCHLMRYWIRCYIGLGRLGDVFVWFCWLISVAWGTGETHKLDEKAWRMTWQTLDGGQMIHDESWWYIWIHLSTASRHWLPSLKLTWTMKMDGWKITLLLGRPIFRGYVSFREVNMFKLLEITSNVFDCFAGFVLPWIWMYRVLSPV